MVLINGKIFTAEDINYNKGYIRIENDKISEIGDMKNLNLNSDEEVIDFSNKFIMPGLIDSHCHLGMWEDSVGFESDDGNEDTDPITPHLRASDGVKIFDKCFTEALEAGITTVFTGPGSSNPAAGLFAAYNTGGKKENMLLKEPICLKIALGENPKSTYHTKNLAPVTRMATIGLLREMFFKTKRYMEEIDDANEDEDLVAPEYNIKFEAVIEVLKGNLPVFAHAHRADDILAAIRLSEEFGFKLGIIHGTDGTVIKEILAKKNIPVLAGPMLCDRAKPELRNLSLKTPGELDKAGILITLITDHPVVPIQFLTTTGGLSVKEGLDYNTALKAMTINPAKIFNLDNLIGSLKTDKKANIAVFDGDPLNLYTKCDAVFIDGIRLK